MEKSMLPEVNVMGSTQTQQTPDAHGIGGVQYREGP